MDLLGADEHDRIPSGGVMRTAIPALTFAAVHHAHGERRMRVPRKGVSHVARLEHLHARKVGRTPQARAVSPHTMPTRHIASSLEQESYRSSSASACTIVTS